MTIGPCCLGLLICKMLIEGILPKSRDKHKLKVTGRLHVTCVRVARVVSLVPKNRQIIGRQTS